jgi:cob(I)alamin adenosyltransferase
MNVATPQQEQRVKIYTKGGDKGQTSLYSGQRVSKNDPLVNAYGTVDELNSSLGLARALDGAPGGERVAEILDLLLPQLFDVAGTMASGKPDAPPRISDDQVRQMELWIDELTGAMPPLTNFILPTGTPRAAALHVARTVCRRAERLTVAVQAEAQFDYVVVRYLNRLADLLFVLARYANGKGEHDVKWITTG